MPPVRKEKEKNQHIQVGVRCRPLDSSEKKRGSYNVVSLDERNREVSVKERALPTAPEKTFTFDKVFGAQSKQIEVYNSMVSPAIKEVLMGYNCTIFAYGQTGTGKTFTMEGDRSEDENVSWEDDPLCGIIPRAMAQLFSSLESNPDCEFSVRVSFLEIYNEELIDLLGAESVENPRLKIYEDTAKKGSCVIQGLEEVVVHSKTDVYGILERGSARRQTAATLMNAHSSRSHSLFMVTIHIKESSTEGEEMLKTGKLNLVDLAGSECIGRSGAVDKRAREAGQINQSLLTLGRVITALVEHAPHVPYRESKLTRLLQDSLGGRTKTSIIATISPASCNIEETMSTLDYAYRAKNITNRPEINQKLTKRALLKTYNEEIERLRKDLQAARDKNGVFLAQDNYDQMQTEIIQKTDTIKELEENIEMLTEEMTKIQELFNMTKEKLEETEQTLEVTSTKLVDTKKNLVKTTQDRDEQKYLVSHHIKSEAKLHSQATQLLGTVEISTSDVDGLHSKLDRKKTVEAKNETAQDQFRCNFHNSITTMQTNLKSQSESQIAALQTVDDNLAAVLKKRSTEVNELVSSLDSITSQVSRDSTSLDLALKSASSQSESRVETLVKKCNETRDLEICRQFDFQEQTFIIAMDELSSLLRHCKQSLNDAAAEMTQQLGAQRDLVERITSENVEHLDKQRRLVEEYCSSHVESVQQQMKVNETNTSSLLSSMQEMFDKLKAQVTTNSSQLSESLEGNKQKTDVFLKGAQTNHTEFSEQINSAKDRLLEQADSHSQTLHTSNTQLVDKVEDLLEKHNSLQVEVSTFSTQTQEDCRSKTDSLIDMLNEYTAEQKTGLEGHLSSLQLLQSQHEKSIQEVKVSQSEQRSQLSAAIGSEQNSLAQSRKTIADWSQSVSEELQSRDHDVETFLTQELSKDMPTGTTPQRREFHYPRVLDKTQRHSLLLQDFRKDYDINMAMETPLPDDSFASQSAISEEGDVNSVHSAHDLSGDSAVSTASGLSSIDGQALDKVENKENKMAPPHKRSVVKTRHVSSTKTSVPRSRTPTPRKHENSTPGKITTPGKKPVSDASQQGKSKLPLRSSNGN